ncbi:MAG: hypothetical protein L6437_01450 [Kiritimatiellae bacterium]|nr:hypothetical protein [Kiritimatiellia bacterium]
MHRPLSAAVRAGVEKLAAELGALAWFSHPNIDMGQRFTVEKFARKIGNLPAVLRTALQAGR